ncbi:MAG: hypothetical protein R2800_03495 [Flavipsychrobacter sp.]
MSRDFELKFDEYKDNNPTEKDGASDPDRYPSGGNVRNLAFVLADGKMQFFNYSYLITCIMDNGAGSILIEFSTHHVALKGQRLGSLYNDLMMQSCKIIRCADKRYSELEENNKPVIQEIDVTNKTD